jgi:predicted metal-binding protein
MSIIKRRVSSWYKSNRVFSLAMLLPRTLIAEARNLFRVLFLYSHPAFLKKRSFCPSYKSRFEEVPRILETYREILHYLKHRLNCHHKLHRNNKKTIR